MTRQEAWLESVRVAVEGAYRMDKYMRAIWGPGFKQTDGAFIAKLRGMVFDHLVQVGVVEEVDPR